MHMDQSSWSRGRLSAWRHSRRTGGHRCRTTTAHQRVRATGGCRPAASDAGRGYRQPPKRRRQAIDNHSTPIDPSIGGGCVEVEHGGEHVLSHRYGTSLVDVVGVDYFASNGTEKENRGEKLCVCFTNWLCFAQVLHVTLIVGQQPHI
jgi:hypothetical protein